MGLNKALFSLQVVPVDVSLQRVLLPQVGGQNDTRKSKTSVSVSLRFLSYPVLNVSSTQLVDSNSPHPDKSNLPASTKHPHEVSVHFGRGKSCVFEEDPAIMRDQLLREPLFILVETRRETNGGRSPDDGEALKKDGQKNCSSSNDNEEQNRGKVRYRCNLIATAALPIRWTGDNGVFFEKVLPLHSPLGSLAGRIRLAIHFRCHGQAMSHHLNGIIKKTVPKVNVAPDGDKNSIDQESNGLSFARDLNKTRIDPEKRNKSPSRSLTSKDKPAKVRSKFECMENVNNRRPSPPVLLYVNDGEDSDADMEDDFGPGHSYDECIDLNEGVPRKALPSHLENPYQNSYEMEVVVTEGQGVEEKAVHSPQSNMSSSVIIGTETGAAFKTKPIMLFTRERSSKPGKPIVSIINTGLHTQINHEKGVEGPQIRVKTKKDESSRDEYEEENMKQQIKATQTSYNSINKNGIENEIHEQYEDNFRRQHPVQKIPGKNEGNKSSTALKQSKEPRRKKDKVFDSQSSLQTKKKPSKYSHIQSKVFTATNSSRSQPFSKRKSMQASKEFDNVVADVAAEIDDYRTVDDTCVTSVEINNTSRDARHSDVVKTLTSLTEPTTSGQEFNKTNSKAVNNCNGSVEIICSPEKDVEEDNTMQIPSPTSSQRSQSPRFSERKNVLRRATALRRNEIEAYLHKSPNNIPVSNRAPAPYNSDAVDDLMDDGHLTVTDTGPIDRTDISGDGESSDSSHAFLPSAMSLSASHIEDDLTPNISMLSQEVTEIYSPDQDHA